MEWAEMYFSSFMLRSPTAHAITVAPAKTAQSPAPKELSENILGSLTTAEPRIAGMESRNEYRTASGQLIPDRRLPVMVEPLLERPGKSAEYHLANPDKQPVFQGKPFHWLFPSLKIV